MEKSVEKAMTIFDIVVDEVLPQAEEFVKLVVSEDSCDYKGLLSHLSHVQDIVESYFNKHEKYQK